MKHAIIIPLILLTAIIAMPAQLSLDDAGNVYRVTGITSELGSYLQFTITNPAGEERVSIVPTTEDSRPDEDPYLTYIADYGQLVLTWSYGDGDYRNIALATFDVVEEEWTAPVLLSSRAFNKRFHSRSLLTKNGQGIGFLHVVWWEEYADGMGDTIYTVIPLGQDGLRVEDRATYNMQVFFDGESAVEKPFPPSAYRYPNMWISGDGNRVTVLAPSPIEGFYYLVRFDFDSCDAAIEDDQRAHFPDIGVKYRISMSPDIETDAYVNSLYSEAGRMVFYWEGENSILYTLFAEKAWSGIRSAPLADIAPESVRALFFDLIH